MNSQSKNNQEYLTRNIRKNLFGSRPKTRSYSGVYQSKNYQNMTIDETFIVRQISFRRPSLGEQRNFSRKWKTIEMKDKVIGVDSSFESSSRKKYRNSKSFIRTCAVDQITQNKLREIIKEGKISIGTEKEQKYFGELVQNLIDSNYFFQKLEKTIVESVVLLGSIKKYEKDTRIDMSKNHQRIGFILYGTGKYFSRDYCYKIEKGDTIGENQLVSSRKKIMTEDESIHKYPTLNELTLKVLSEMCVLWIGYNHFNILRQESIKQGFRQQFNKFDTQLRMSFLKKKNQKGQSSLKKKQVNCPMQVR